MLEIRDLHVQFHGADHEAVRGIDLTVGDGEIVGLVGESGSGKTVTAMMISGLLRPEQAAFRGQILLDGRDLLTSSGDTLRSIQGRDICVVFQEPMSAMDPTMRIGPQVEECLRVHTDLPPGKRRELALQALREDEIACEAMGIDITRVKLSAFALGSCWAGFAGVIFAAKTTYINPSSFTFMESAMILSMVVLGGMGSITGVVIAALILILVPEYLRAFSEYRMLLFGLTMVIMMLFRPQGLISGERRRYHISAPHGEGKGERS